MRARYGPDLLFRVPGLLVGQHEFPDGQRMCPGLIQHLRAGRRTGRAPRASALRRGRFAFTPDESAAGREIDLAANRLSGRIRNREPHRVRMSRQNQIAMPDQIARFDERHRLLSQQHDRARGANPVQLRLDLIQIDRIGRFSQKPQQYRPVGRVPFPCKRERSIQFNPNRGGSREQSIPRQCRRELARRAHGTHGVGTGRSDTNLEELEDAGPHRLQVSAIILSAMKAVVLHGYGGADQLRYEDAPKPEPGAGEVLVRVISTSVNPIDYKLRGGMMKDRMPLEFPVILGRDVAGEVTALGSGVTQFKVGDLVMGLVNRSYAEYLTAKADLLAGIPQGLDPKEAGVVPLVTTTGSQLMEKGIQPKQGEVVLVTGAAGNVGRTAVFVAKQHGAKVIAGVRISQRAEARSLAADSIVALDDDREIAGLPELDAIADTVGGETIGKLIPKLKKSARLATVVGKPEAAAKAGIEVREVWAQSDADRLYQLAENVRDGKLDIPIALRLPLSEIRLAHEAAEKGVSGKIALLP